MNARSNSSKNSARAGTPRRPNIRSDQRTVDVTRAASRLFLRFGFNGVSLEMIVAEAGGSYREIYSEFGGKRALFEKVMWQMCTEILAPLRQELTASELHRLPLTEALTHLGDSVLKALLKPPALAFHRLMISEAPRFPELAKNFYRSGPSEAYTGIAAFLSARTQKERLSIENVDVAGAAFVDALVGSLQLKALTGGRVSRLDITNHVRQVVHLFLHGATRRS